MLENNGQTGQQTVGGMREDDARNSREREREGERKPSLPSFFFLQIDFDRIKGVNASFLPFLTFSVWENGFI